MEEIKTIKWRTQDGLDFVNQDEAAKHEDYLTNVCDEVQGLPASWGRNDLLCFLRQNSSLLLDLLHQWATTTFPIPPTLKASKEKVCERIDAALDGMHNDELSDLDDDFSEDDFIFSQPDTTTPTQDKPSPVYYPEDTLRHTQLNKVLRFLNRKGHNGEHYLVIATECDLQERLTNDLCLRLVTDGKIYRDHKGWYIITPFIPSQVKDAIPEDLRLTTKFHKLPSKMLRDPSY